MRTAPAWSRRDSIPDMRIRMTVAYVGTRYQGWQVQSDRPTVQGSVEEAVARLEDTDVRVTGASRTDAGVHAAGQVCHFDAGRDMAPDEWQRALNSLLPADVRILDVVRADDDFHARYSARQKIYRYHLDRSAVASPFLAAFCWHCPRLERLDALADAAAQLVGPIDQRVFASQPEGDRPIRPVDECTVATGRLVTISVSGRSFLRHAVRGMVGALVEVAQGRRSGTELAALARETAARPRSSRHRPTGSAWRKCVTERGRRCAIHGSPCARPVTLRRCLYRLATASRTWIPTCRSPACRPCRSTSTSQWCKSRSPWCCCSSVPPVPC